MNGPTRDAPPKLLLALVIAGVAAFLTFFFNLGLPNAGWISRWDVWWYALPGLALDSTPLPIDAFRRILDLGHVGQRLPIFGYAALVVGAAIGAGAICLRALGLTMPPFERRPNQSSESQSREGFMTSREWLVLAFGSGMSVLSLATLGCGLAGFMNRAAFLILLVALAGGVAVAAWRNRWQNRAALGATNLSPREAAASPLALSLSHKFARAAGVSAVCLFLTITLLGAVLPATDFDVREYHLQGPKEFFQAGRVQYLPHNVYTTMPFATGMLNLLGMIVAGDWWWGALVGQVVLASFAPLTALGVWSLGRRLFSPAAGSIAALIYITTPWVYRISIIPYTENALCFFLLAGTLAVVLAVRTEDRGGSAGYWLLAGVLAGTAAACKYPALISTVLPLGTAAVAWPFIGRFRSPELRRSASESQVTPNQSAARILVRSLLPLTLGVLLACGPWLAKNWIVTGNPTYPLLYGVFGGRDWTPEKNAKWEWGHRVPLLVWLGATRPPDDRPINPADSQHAITWRRLAANLNDVVAQADWQSPLVFGLAPLAFLDRRGRRAAAWLWLFVGFLFLQWWLLTHRLDRFWVPLEPIAAVLAGAGAVWTASRAWRAFLAGAVAIVVYFNFSFCTTSLCGNNDYAGELVARSDPLPLELPRDQRPVNFMNRELPADARVLAVGAADLFHLDRRLVYNTVFDDSIFEQLVRDKTPDSAARALSNRGITHVYVSWSEVYRYRGTYGYTAFVTPAEFTKLVVAGVLHRLIPGPAMHVGTANIGSHEVRDWELYEVDPGRSR